MIKPQQKTSAVTDVKVYKLTGPPPPIDAEFNPGSQSAIFAAAGLPVGLCLGSKSDYRRTHDRHFFVPNANVFCRDFGKVWWGDLDLWCHAPILERVAHRLRRRLYVLSEFDGRFENAALEFSEARLRAVWHTGGRVRPDCRSIRRSGLSHSQLALLLGVPASRVATRQLPYVAQQLNRRLYAIQKTFEPFARHYGFRSWGAWFLAPHRSLHQRTPLTVYTAGEPLVLADLFPDIFSNEKLLEGLLPAVQTSLLLCGGPVSLAWPCRSKHGSRDAI